MSKRSGKKGKLAPVSGKAFSNNAFSALGGLGAAPPSTPTDQLPAEDPVNSPTDDGAKTREESRFPNKLVVRREKKGRRGKTVTRVSGVPARELVLLCNEMKKALGCGATVEEQELVLLGDLEPRAVAWLEKAGASRIARGT